MFVYIGSNPISVIDFSDYACLEQGVPWNSNNLRLTFHSAQVCNVTNTPVSVFRLSNFTIRWWNCQKLIQWWKLLLFLGKIVFYDKDKGFRQEKWNNKIFHCTSYSSETEDNKDTNMHTSWCKSYQAVN